MEGVHRARVLAVVEQTLIADLPAGWRDLGAPRNRKREAAAVLLRLAEQPALAEMQRSAAEAAARAAKRRHDPEAGEARFWEGLKALLTDLGEVERPASLAGLALWGEGPARSLIDRAERALPGGAAGSGVDENTLTALALLLLRARARRWLIEAREAEQPERPHPEEVA